MPRWWEYDQERYQREIDDLENAGIEYERDRHAFSTGKVVLHVRFPVEGEFLALTIKYPDTYPYFRPQIIAPHINLPFHQNPADKTLCLLDQVTGSWNPEETAYGLLVQQLPKVLTAGASANSASVAQIEVHQAEPRSEYYRYKHGSVLLIDGDWDPGKSCDRGLFLIGFDPNVDPTTTMVDGLRGAVLEIYNEAGGLLEKAPNGIREIFSSKQQIKGHWIRLETAPNVADAEGLLQFIQSNCPKEAKYIDTRISSGGGVIGFVFPEEKQWRGQHGVGWLFLTFYGKKKKPNIAYLTKAERAGYDDLRERIPELYRLADKKIAVVGCGCVGAQSVVEFAKCGIGEMRLWDGDTVSPGNACRWPIGVPFSGWLKVQALACFLKIHYPHTRFGLLAGLRLGDPNSDESSAIEQILEGVDLIFDATAERGVQLFLSSMARVMGKPYVMAESRPGGWGGVIARIRSGEGGGCYYCLLHSLADGSMQQPPAKEEDFIQPQGCITPTFTAAGFDTSTISLAAVRLAVSTLLEGHEGCYPATEHDVGILSLRDPSSGLATFPTWTTHRLSKHPNCHCCR